MINSISGEDGRYEMISPLVKEYGSNVVLLCMDSSGMPETSEDRMKVVDTLYARLKEDGIDDSRMFFDALVKPVSSITTAGIEVLDTNWKIRNKYPEVHQILGLSNISYGLPKRARLNRVFIIETMARGVDGYIINPTLRDTMADIITAQTLLGNDPYCKNYIKANRKGLFD
jgi:5-methyltetrahydrofolate--homocysteine methyltransferase